ncbi:MAG TPA: response regulator [Xenococcaceae cyanobacterium]
MIRILIVDDQKSIRERLTISLQVEADLAIVGTAEDGYDALEKIKQWRPDVILVDLEMPALDGITLTRMIHQNFAEIKVIVLSMHDEEAYINQSLQAGAIGYLLKNTPPSELKEAIRFVSRGYTQFSPGVLNKIVPVIPNESATTASVANHNQQNWEIEPLSWTQLTSFFTSKNRPIRSRKNPKAYLPYWIGSNLLLWTIAILYLTFKTPTYISKWAISLPAGENYTSLSIPEIGSVTSNTDSPYGNSLFDPREDYKFLLRSKEIVAIAATQLGMSRSEFGSPEIEIVDNTTMIELSIAGETAEQAQQKAIALQQVLEAKLIELRQSQISQTDNSLQTSLKKSAENLRLAREKLADYQGNSQLGSRDTLENLAANLATLQRQKAETKAQLEQTRAKVAQLANNLNISPQSAKAAFALQSDTLFQRYLAEYTRLSAELISLESRFQPSNPAIINQKEATQATRSALVARGENLLGESLPPELLQQLSLGTEGEDDSYRGNLLQDIVTLQSETRGLESQIRELDNQIFLLNTQENTLVQQESVRNRLEQELKLAETVYSSNLAKSQLAETNLYHAYPQIQMAIQPNLPNKPSEPNPKLIILGTFLSCLFLNTAIASIWANSTAKKPPATMNNHHQEIAPETAIDPILKK